MRLHLADYWLDRIDAMAIETIDEGDGMDSIQRTYPGSIFQLCTDKLIQTMDGPGKRVFDYWMKPLGRREPNLRCSWYMRREVRFFPWLVLWKASAVWERCAIAFFNRADRWGFLDPNDGAELSWNDWRWRWWRSKSV